MQKEANVIASLSATALPTSYDSTWRLSVSLGQIRNVLLCFDYTYSSATEWAFRTYYVVKGTAYSLRKSNYAMNHADNVQSSPASDTPCFELDTGCAGELRIEAKRTGGSSSDTLALTVLGSK